MAPCPVRRTKAAKARARKVAQSKVRSTKRRSPVSRSTQQRVESLGSAKTKIEAPLLKDFTKEYGIPKTQFAWGSREPSPEKESFDEEETAPPPVIIAPYFRYGSGMRRMLATHRPPASFKNSLLLQCPRPSLPHASQFLLKSSREMIKVPKRLSLMDFPAEVREHIYRGLLVSNKPIPVYDRWKRFMADAIKIFACEPYTTNIHTLRIIISPRYEGGKFTFADFFEPGSGLMVALRAVCCDTIRIKIQNKFLNEGLGVPSSELVLHVRQLRFYKHLRHDELRGKDDTERRDPWKKDSKMKQFRFEQLCKINDRLMALKRSVIRACKKHVKPHVVRRGDLGPMNWNADAEEEDWEDWDVQEQDDEGSEEDMDQEFEEPSDDNDSDYEM
ncbi:uncharacterized protein QYS62_006102 [Fusarium acuminatum]|uniref:Uncharacterized protein n=1 Tax=Fusarium acuminatum TaxID=5515 RepID=A0ABZ2WWB8_9HYPO